MNAVVVVVDGEGWFYLFLSARLVLGEVKYLFTFC